MMNDHRRFALIMEINEDQSQFMGWYMTPENAEAGAKALLQKYPMYSFHIASRVSCVSAQVSITSITRKDTNVPQED